MPKVTQSVRMRGGYLENTLRNKPTCFLEIIGFSFNLQGKQHSYLFIILKEKIGMLKMLAPAVLITIDTELFVEVSKFLSRKKKLVNVLQKQQILLMQKAEIAHCIVATHHVF